MRAHKKRRDNSAIIRLEIKFFRNGIKMETDNINNIMATKLNFTHFEYSNHTEISIHIFRIRMRFVAN